MVKKFGRTRKRSPVSQTRRCEPVPQPPLPVRDRGRCRRLISRFNLRCMAFARSETPALRCFLRRAREPRFLPLIWPPADTEELLSRCTVLTYARRVKFLTMHTTLVSCTHGFHGSSHDYFDDYYPAPGPSELLTSSLKQLTRPRKAGPFSWYGIGSQKKIRSRIRKDPDRTYCLFDKT